MKKFLLILVSLLVIFVLGKNLLPSNIAFDYHDSTQPARIKEFTYDLKNGQIPPRIAPGFSFNLGYPVFNYYAPTAYWVTSAINLLGIEPINSIKLSFLLTVIIGFLGMYFLGNELIGYPAGIIAGALLVSSPWMAVQIFIRGDLAEAWFIALFPLTLYLIKKNSDHQNKLLFLATTLTTSLFFTSHNILSFVGMAILIVYVLIIKKNLLRGFAVIMLAFLLAGYFFLPALTELKYTHAIEIATKAGPYSSFLCLKQIWTGAWGYGASVVGCDDGMAFMIGKLMIILAFLGIFWGIGNFKKIKNKWLFCSLVFLALMSAFMTIYQSEFIWRIFYPILKLFQFSWRFLDITILASSLLAGYLIFNNKNFFVKAGLTLLVIVNIFYNTKFFTKFPMSVQKLTHDLLSNEYITTSVVYYVPEYLPITVSYKDWLNYQPKKTSYKIDPYVNKGPVVSRYFFPVSTVKDTPFYKEAMTLLSGEYILNIHYLSYWKIYVNDKLFIPKKFDDLGRPLVNLTSPSTVKIIYQQTPIEVAGNLITLLTVAGLLIIVFNKNLWKKLMK
ncbi:6-pyruvoyl-tetrahydropterin synthase-related protein [Patescibacteria group bacterium]|nr:6-pyruvoyl-tetrahydropterin synthase-related protein [Patescibacteria group bacterium]